MPYQNDNDLPENVKNNLPEHAQHIYREAFNNAIEEYDSEGTAHAVAWSAVEKKYHKDENGEWVENS
jgi:cation transport regulator